MSPVISDLLVAHARGWDEMLIAAGAIVGVVLLRLRAERRRAKDAPPEDEPANTE